MNTITPLSRSLNALERTGIARISIPRAVGIITATKLRAATVLLLLLVAFLEPVSATEPVVGRPNLTSLTDLHVMSPLHPRAFFFRSAEGLARRSTLSYDGWDRIFDRLMGIEGKVLDEEIPGTLPRNVEFFTRFKREHPEQLVLLHYNGNARDPRYDIKDYFAGHWLYYEGQTLPDDLPAEDEISDIRVEHPEWFRTGSGRYRTSNDDVCICELDQEGKPDWHCAEQLQLISVDVATKKIRVRRGCYGTLPRCFDAGKAYLAVHATEGPWGRKSNLLWHYNYSTTCPVDSDSRTCSDVHAAELARRFRPAGELAAFDGLEFDVLHHTKRQYGPRATFPGIDCDGDGVADRGMFDSVDQYAVGVIHFLQNLRRQLGEEELILADGHSPNSQRGFGILNGIESEGWPSLSDWAMKDWSGGMNRHAYWAAFGREPVFNYINHKYVTHGEIPGQILRPEYSAGIDRLVFAAAAFTDAAVCYSMPPRPESGEAFGIWDELRMGTEHRLGWLGSALGPPVRLAERAPDLLNGQFQPPTGTGLARLAGDDVVFSSDHDGTKIEAADEEADRLQFVLRDCPTDGGNFFVSMTAAANSLPSYPETMARLSHAGIRTVNSLISRGDAMTTGMQRRGESIAEIDPQTGAAVSWAGPVTLGDRACTALRAHPPYRDRKTGMVFWEREILVPDGAVLRLCTGMGDKAPGRSDGVVFIVRAHLADDGGYEDAPVELLRHTQTKSEWIEHKIPLGQFGGEKVRLRFIADAGPQDNATTDHGYWGEVFTAVPDAEGNTPVPREQRFMTWTGRQAFTSRFYFRDIPAGRIDLTFEFEGSEPVTISSLSAHAAADIVYREFERGLVVANPSEHPVTFDLARLLPGKRYRRIRGSSRQDPATNDGQPVGARLSLPAMDALFLVRMQL